MTQPRDAETCLRDVLDAAKLALVFIAGLDEGRFSSDLKSQAAVVRQLEIIGEAANRIPKPIQATLPNIPWKKLISMRNRLIHCYDDVEVGIVWYTATDELDTLIEAVESAIKEIANAQDG